MTVSAIIGADIMRESGCVSHHAIVIQDGRISAILPASEVPESAHRIRLDGGMIAAGFIDTQVNGGGGVLFNDSPTVDGIAAIAAAHRSFGTTALLPTLISDNLDVIAQAIAAVDAAILAGVPGIIGIHIEGPFLNADKRGIHDAAKFRTLDTVAVALLSSLKHGKTLVTLAPELAPDGMIAALVDRGVVVCAGHSMASYADIEHGVAAGLRGMTHLFNAMTPLESRNPGMVGAAFASHLICGIIVDGHHVHPGALRAAYRAKGADELMLVTDAMPVVGFTRDDFMLGDVHIQSHDGRLVSADGTLAGSNLDMASAVRNATAMIGISGAEALHMASGTPARLMGLDAEMGRIAPGYRADLVHLDDAMMVQNVWIGGVLA